MHMRIEGNHFHVVPQDILGFDSMVRIMCRNHETAIDCAGGIQFMCHVFFSYKNQRDRAAINLGATNRCVMHLKHQAGACRDTP